MAEPGVDLLRHSSPFIGRAQSLAALQAPLPWATSQLSPQLVTILGVPGIGKTRLVSELRQVGDGAGEPVRWRQGRSPLSDASLLALGEMIKAGGGILESDAAQKADYELRAAVGRVIEIRAEARRVATFLGPLIGLGSEEPAIGDRRGEMFVAWRRYLEALADERPLVLVFEDVHWADDALLDFVDEMVEQISGVPLLVIATARPELLERRPGWAGGKAGALTISIPPLSRSGTTQLVAALLERTRVTPETHAAPLDAIGGHPLYAEQLCRMLAEPAGSSCPTVA
jgi:predicted ATPase